MHMQAIQQAAPSADHKIKVRFGLYMSSLRLLEDRSVEFPFNLNTFINNVASWEALVSAVGAETSASVIWSLVRYAVEKIDFARLGSIALAELKQLSLIATSAGLVYYKFPNAGIYVSLASAAGILILASRAIPSERNLRQLSGPTLLTHHRSKLSRTQPSLRVSYRRTSSHGHPRYLRLHSRQSSAIRCRSYR